MPLCYYDCLYDLAQAYATWHGLSTLHGYRYYCALVGVA
jgi:hypothetical protein